MAGLSARTDATLCDFPQKWIRIRAEGSGGKRAFHRVFFFVYLKGKFTGGICRQLKKNQRNPWRLYAESYQGPDGPLPTASA